MQDTDLEKSPPWMSQDCPYCHHFYKSEPSYTKHLLHDGLGCTRFCAPCDSTFPNTHGRARHEQTNKHKLQLRELKALEDFSPITCSLCSLTFRTIDDINFHLDGTGRDQTPCKSTCQHCLCTLRDERACRAHEAICIDNSGKPATTDFRCTRCRLDCKSALELHRHQLNNVTRCQHACRHCLSTLASVPERKSHEHECASRPATTPTCLVCTRRRTFITMQELRKHLQHHLGTPTLCLLRPALPSLMPPLCSSRLHLCNLRRNDYQEGTSPSALEEDPSLQDQAQHSFYRKRLRHHLRLQEGQAPAAYHTACPSTAPSSTSHTSTAPGPTGIA